MDKIIQFIKDLDIGTKITAGVLLILIFISGILLINNGRKTEVKEVATVTLKDVNIIDNASGFLINDNKLTLENGVNYLMTVEKVPKTAGDSKLKYKSDNEEVATVDDLGLIKTKTIGTATITVSSVDNESILDKLTLEVIKTNIKAEKISLSESSLKLATDQIMELKATVLPEETVDKSLEWSSSNKEIATVDNFGKITAKKEGDVTITAKTSNGILSKCEVEIANIQVESIDLSEENLTLERGKEKKISATIKPENANDKKITWNSENDTIAEVSTEGTIKAITIGTVLITARTSNGKKDTIKVTVVEPNDSNQTASNSAVITPTASTEVIYPSEIILELDELELYPNEQKQIIATVEPEDATNKSITWSSSDNNVASVDNNGLVTAIKAGLVTITARTNNEKTSSANIIVDENPDEPTGVSLSSTLVNIYTGEQQQITAKIDPDSATDKTVTWSSSDNNVASVNDSGLITGINSGTATITAKTSNDKTTLVNVTINSVISTTPTASTIIDSIVLNIKNVLLKKNQTQQTTIVFTPNNVSNKNITWTSSDTSIATVTNTGLVTAKSVGTVTITATTYNGKTATAKFMVSE